MKVLLYKYTGEVEVLEGVIEITKEPWAQQLPVQAADGKHEYDTDTVVKLEVIL